MLKWQTAADLGVAAVTGLLERTGLAPEAVQDVILGHCYPSSEAPAIGRVVALDSGLPVTVPGMQVDRRCGSGLQAVIPACLPRGHRHHHLLVAGGCERTGEPPRADTSAEWFSKLKPVLLGDDPEATVTAGNASGQNDAASMCVVTTPEKAEEHGLTPLVRMVSWGSAGVAPDIMGIGPVPPGAGGLAQHGPELTG